MDIKKTDVPGFPAGWRREESIRRSGLLAGKSDVCYISPSGEKCFSKHDLVRLLGDRVDLSCFDFSSGKVLQSVLRRNKSVRSGNVVDTHKGSQADAGTTLPIRQTASIFKQPVTVVHSHPESQTNRDLKHGSQEPPQQLFWQKRLQGYNATDMNCEPLKQLELPASIQLATMDLTSQGVLHSIAAALHFNNRPIIGQSASRPVLMKNFAINVNVEQPLIQSVSISEQDIHRQETRVLEVRKRLQAAVNVYNQQKIRRVEAS